MSLRRCAALLCAASLAATPASRPSVSTQHDELKVATAYNRRTLVEAYGAVGQHDPKWDGPAHALLEKMATRFASANFVPMYLGGPVTDTTESLRGLADAAKNCPDPLVGYCRAALYRDTGADGKFTDVLRRIGPKLIDAEAYPLYRRVFAANAMALKFPKETQWKQKRDELAAKLLLEPVADPPERRYVLARVIETLWDRQGNQGGGSMAHNAAERQPLIDTVAADPKADPWVLNMLRGYHEISYAWEFRGSGYANTVTEAGWAGFRDHIKLARDALTAAYEAEPNYPEAPAMMCVVCMAESTDAREWFDRAITGQVDYMTAWSNYAEGLRPRWGGTMKGMLDLGREAVQTGRFDTVAPFFMGDALDMMRQENGTRDAVYRVPGVWTALDDMFDGYLTALPKGLDVPWTASRSGVYAWKCGQYAEAKRTFDTVGEQLRQDAFDSFGAEWPEVRDECAARAGPLAGEIKKLDTQETLARYTAAADGYDKLVAAMAADDASRAFCVRHRLIDRVRQQIKDGQSAELLLADPDALLCFRGDVGAWKLVDGAIEFQAKDRWSRLVYMMPLPETGSVRVEWSWTPLAEAAGESSPELDVIVRDTEREGFIFGAVNPTKDLIAVRLGEKFWVAHRGPPDHPVTTPPNDWHTTTIRRRGNTVAVDQDGQSAIDWTTDDWLRNGRPVLGLIGRTGPGETRIRVRKIVIEPES